MTKMNCYQQRFKPVEERFWEKVDKTLTCWLWTGTQDTDGYGKFTIGSVTVKAHSFAYELLVGPVPKQFEIDHVKANGCTSTLCVKAIADEYGLAHLEPVTHRENLLRSETALAAINARKTHCKRGHSFDDANTYWHKGRRHCRACRADWDRSHRR